MLTTLITFPIARLTRYCYNGLTLTTNPLARYATTNEHIVTPDGAAAANAALVDAVRTANLQRMLTALDAGADVNSTDTMGETALHKAAALSSGGVFFANLLLDRGADPSVSDRYGRTPLHVAAYFGNSTVTARIFAAGGNPNSKDNDGNTPLHQRSALSPQIIELFLKNGFDMHARNNVGHSVLDIALHCGEVSRWLLETAQSRHTPTHRR